MLNSGGVRISGTNNVGCGCGCSSVEPEEVIVEKFNNGCGCSLEAETETKEVIKELIYCQVGLRGYIATRLLLQNGYKAKNLTGGYKSFSVL